MVGGHGQHLLHRLRRRQQFGNDARTRFVGAVVLAVAVVALDVAGRRHGDVHAREVVMRLFRIAGVVLHLGADVVGQMAQGVRGRTAAAGCTTAAFG
jgi:hypothetical protein